MTQKTEKRSVNRLYKSRIFVMLYENKEELLELYNAVSGKHYEDPELLEINTLEDANLYGTKLVQIPAPKFIVFYNGVEDAPERAITECIEEGILSDFLERNRAEAKSVSIYEYDQEKHMRQEREDAWADGVKQGETDKLRAQIQKKLEKGKSIEQIAEELEEEEAVIRELMEALKV